MTISASYPFTLTNGTTADATQVMADFLQIQNDVNTNAAHNGANSDITSLLGLTTPLSVAQGGTGANTAGATAAHNIGALAIASNLSDVSSTSTALSNLGGAALASSPTFTGGSIISQASSAAGTVSLLANNTATGAAAYAGVFVQTGTANSSASLVVEDNSGSPVAYIALGSAITNFQIPNNTVTNTQALNDSSIKVATTAFANPASSISTNGYVKLSSGLIIQWASFESNSSGFTNWTFPITFPNAVLHVLGAHNNTGGAASSCIVVSWDSATSTTAYASINANFGGTSYNELLSMFAIGY